MSEVGTALKRGRFAISCRNGKCLLIQYKKPGKSRLVLYEVDDGYVMIEHMDTRGGRNGDLPEELFLFEFQSIPSICSRFSMTMVTEFSLFV
jgi:hypothetical protein